MDERKAQQEALEVVARVAQTALRDRLPEIPITGIREWSWIGDAEEYRHQMVVDLAATTEDGKKIGVQVVVALVELED